ncbi:hypothetical protein [Calidithermus chliarophilus]|uniref:hypothetical protein n=1 Tax=Calidithermus chliarophilus TaxID=52023 RepID=UPI0012F69AF7|nr:hypothetical protein [Calidithermus chliarophilus]
MSRPWMLLLPLLLGLGWADTSARGSHPVLVRLPGSERADLLGSSRDGRWVEAQRTAPGVAGGERYRVFAGPTALGEARGSRPESGEPCDWNYGVALSPNPSPARWVVATTAPWNLQPRKVEELPAANSPYAAVVRDLLARKGLRNPQVRLTRVLRADLEGDGRQEVILAATRYTGRDEPFPPGHGEVGDYSLAVVRRLASNDPASLQTLELGASVTVRPSSPGAEAPQPYALRFDVVGVYDLNGDGRMELVFWDAFYEGYTLSVLEWDGKGFREALSTGCGA